MPFVRIRVTILGALATLVALPAALAGAALPTPELFEWVPNGDTSGPQVVLEVKSDVTGHFGVQCGKSWLYTYFGGGESDPINQDAAASTISGTENFLTNEVGIGSTYEAAESDYQLIKHAGPLVMTINAQVTPSVAQPNAATGTLTLTLYNAGSVLPGTTASVARRHRHKVHRKHHRKHSKPTRTTSKPTVVATCQVPFDAPNHYG
jgi:hypothetical protein